MSAANTPPLTGRVALVVGASRGLGHALSLCLANAGAHPILVARTIGALEALDDTIHAATGISATLAPLDISQPAQSGAPDPLAVLAQSIAERWGRLDILAMTPAYFPPLMPAAQLPDAEWEQSITLNLSAARRTLAATEPLLRRGRDPRALFIGDALAHTPRPYMAAYAATKAALEALVLSWGREMKPFGVLANVAVPPPFRSRLRATGWPGEDPDTLPAPKGAAEACLPLLLPKETRGGARIPLETAPAAPAKL